MAMPICDEDDINLLNSLEMKLMKWQGVSSRKAIGIITAFLPLIFYTLFMFILFRVIFILSRVVNIY